jgi:iron complex transport system ATP-binding protein
MTVSTKGLRAEKVHFSYGDIGCLHDLSIELKAGRFYGLIGPNGSGKSTFLDIISGFISPHKGIIYCNGIKLHQYTPADLALILTAVPQSIYLNFDYTVHDVVMMGRHPHIPRFASPKETDFTHVEQAIELMGISHLAARKVMQLSGGEKQRVMVARALAQDTEMILLDEVTSNLDINHSISIMKTMLRLVKNDGRTVIAAMHDLNMAAAFCEDLIVLDQGKLSYFGPVSEVISENLISELYGVATHLTRDSGGKQHIKFIYR